MVIHGGMLHDWLILNLVKDEGACVFMCTCAYAFFGMSAWADDVVFVCKKLLSSSVFCWQVLSRAV